MSTTFNNKKRNRFHDYYDLSPIDKFIYQILINIDYIYIRTTGSTKMPKVITTTINPITIHSTQHILNEWLNDINIPPTTIDKRTMNPLMGYIISTAPDLITKYCRSQYYPSLRKIPHTYNNEIKKYNEIHTKPHYTMDRNMTALTLGAAIPPDITQTIIQTKQSYHYHNDIIDWLLEPQLLIAMLQNIPAHRYEYIRNNYIINNENYSNRKKHRAHNNPTTNNKNKHHVPAWKQKDDEAKAQNPELTNDPYATPGEVLLSPEERAKNAQAVLDSLE